MNSISDIIKKPLKRKFLTLILRSFMMNIIDYVKKSNKAINVELALHALILSQSLYFKFEKIDCLQNKLPLKLKSLKEESQSDAFDISHKSKMLNNHIHLMNALINSPIYGEIEILDFQYEMIESIEKQFAAITYRLNDDQFFIAFRGTDSSMLGWKEDVNMSYIENVPSQLSAKKYLEKILNKYPYSFYLAGHSKGGNVAVYSATMCGEVFFPRIRKIYNFDGPGFQSDFINNKKYENTLKITEKYVPQFSFFGTLMNSSEPLSVIKSTSISLFQHDVYSWLVEGDNLIFADKTTNLSRRLSKSIEIWLKTISEEERKEVIDEVFKGFQTLNINTTEDLWNLLSIQSIKDIINIYNNTNPSIRDYVKEITRQLLVTFLLLKK